MSENNHRYKPSSGDTWLCTATNTAIKILQLADYQGNRFVIFHPDGVTPTPGSLVCHQQHPDQWWILVDGALAPLTTDIPSGEVIRQRIFDEYQGCHVYAIPLDIFLGYTEGEGSHLVSFCLLQETAFQEGDVIEVELPGIEQAIACSVISADGRAVHASALEGWGQLSILREYCVKLC